MDLIDGQTGKSESIKLANALASYSWPERPMERTIDDNVIIAWHVWGKLGQAHWAVFTLAEPIERTESSIILITLRHGGDLAPVWHDFDWRRPAEWQEGSHGELKFTRANVTWRSVNSTIDACR